MRKKEYVVTLKNKDDLSAFYKDMETIGGSLSIPNRVIPVKNRRPVSRNTTYLLTESEAKKISKDPRVLSVELTFEEFLEIIKERNCHYCGEDLNYEEYSRVWGKTNSRAHQLDRKNNDLGYTKDNVVTCCWECNRLKSDRFTYEEFIQFSPILKKIQSERKRKETP